MTQIALSRNEVQPEQPWFVMNAAHHVSLTVADNPAISHFYNFDISENASLTLAVPDGCVDIIFDCNEHRPLARVCGTTLEARRVDLRHNHRYFGIRFAPGVIPNFIDVVAEELPDHEYSFLDVVTTARVVFEQIVQARDFSRQIALFNAHFSPNLIRKPSLATLLALQIMQQQKGNIRIDQLETVTGYTCRTLQRQFRLDTGLSPKAFSRILRFQSALNRFHTAPSISVSDLACDLGFSDQSHLSREFKKFSSITPYDYQRRVAEEGYCHRLRGHQH